MLVVRKDFHPALVPLLLMTATRIHGKGDELSDPGEFPSELYCDFPVSEDAKHFYESASPCCSGYFPFWLASLVDRAKVMLIPLIMLMMPLLRAAPPLMRWRTRRKIYLWYSDLREIDQRLVTGLSGPSWTRNSRTERDRAPGGLCDCPAELHGGVLPSPPAPGDVAAATHRIASLERVECRGLVYRVTCGSIARLPSKPTMRQGSRILSV